MSATAFRLLRHRFVPSLLQNCNRVCWSMHNNGHGAVKKYTNETFNNEYFSDGSHLSKLFQNYGLDSKTIKDLIDSNSDLFKHSPVLWEDLFTVLVNNGFWSKQCFDMIVACPDLLTVESTLLEERIIYWQKFGFSVKNIKLLMHHNPIFLAVPVSELRQRLPVLKLFCQSFDKIIRLLYDCPNIMYDNWYDVQLRIHYIMRVMKINNKTMTNCHALKMSFDDIRIRHLFLERVGKFFTPKNDKPTMLTMNNPKLTEITDSSERNFAKKIAGVTLIEFQTFRELVLEYEPFEEEIDHFFWK